MMATMNDQPDPHKLLEMMPMGGLNEKLGVEILEATAERVVGTMPVEGNTQPYGLLHGGASIALAETLGSIGSALHGLPDKLSVGVDINATHHRSARAGIVTGVHVYLSRRGRLRGGVGGTPVSSAGSGSAGRR